MAQLTVAFIAVATLVCILATRASSPNSASLQQLCDNKDGVTMPMPGSCNYFVICSNGRALANSCGPLFHFNARTGHCDHPDRAGCKVNSHNEGASFSVDSIPSTTIDGSHKVLLPRPPLFTTSNSPKPQEPLYSDSDEDHSAFIDSESSISNKVVLPRPPLFTVLNSLTAPQGPPNPTNNFPTIIVIKPNNTNTQSPIVPKPNRPIQMVADLLAGSICQNREVGALLPKPDSCEDYYVCYKEKAFRRTCPSGKHFNSTASLCQAPEIARCVLEHLNLPKLPPRETEEDSSKGNPCQNVFDGALLPHSTACGNFYICSHNSAFVMACPEGLHFSVQQNRCEWPWIAKCNL